MVSLAAVPLVPGRVAGVALTLGAPYAGAITGVITDSSGAVLPSVTLKARRPRY